MIKFKEDMNTDSELCSIDIRANEFVALGGGHTVIGGNAFSHGEDLYDNDNYPFKYIGESKEVTDMKIELDKFDKKRLALVEIIEEADALLGKIIWGIKLEENYRGVVIQAINKYIWEWFWDNLPKEEAVVVSPHIERYSDNALYNWILHDIKHSRPFVLDEIGHYQLMKVLKIGW